VRGDLEGFAEFQHSRSQGSAAKKMRSDSRHKSGELIALNQELGTRDPLPLFGDLDRLGPMPFASSRE